MAQAEALRPHDVRNFFRGVFARARSPRTIGTAVGAAGTAMLLAAAAFWLAGPRPTASAVIQIDPRAVEMISAQASPIADPAAALTSPTLLADVVALEALDRDREFSAAQPSRLGRALDVLHRAATAPRQNDRLAVRDPSVPQRALDGLRRAISVDYDPETARATVSVSSVSPRKAARIANTLARRYVARQRAWNATADARIAGATADRRERLLRELRTAEADLARASAVAGATGELLPGDLRLTETADRLAAARQRRAAAEADVRRAVRLRSGALDLDAAPAAELPQAVAQLRERRESARRAIAELSTRFGERHPTLAEARAELGAIDQAIDRELERAIIDARADLERASAEERALGDTLERMRNDALASARQRAELRRLEQLVADRRTAYESFVSRLQRMDDAGSAGSARIVTRAEPPGTHGWLRFAVIAAAGVLAGAVAVGFGAARPQSAARGSDLDDPASLDELTGLPLLARFPRLPGRPWWRRHKPAVGAPRLLHADGLPAVVFHRPASAAALAFSRLAGQLAHPASPPDVRTVLVTAPEPGDGKSTVALNLALAAAADGRRALLVDADPARQALSAAAGFADAELVSVEPQPGVAWPTAPLVIDERWDVRFVCAALPRAAGASVAESLRATAQGFDLVVVDGPSIGGPNALQWQGEVATDILLAVRRGSTSRHALLAALPPLERYAAKMRGCVAIED